MKKQNLDTQLLSIQNFFDQSEETVKKSAQLVLIKKASKSTSVHYDKQLRDENEIEAPQTVSLRTLITPIIGLVMAAFVIMHV